MYIFNRGFCKNVTCAFLLQENIHEFPELINLKSRKNDTIFNIINQGSVPQGLSFSPLKHSRTLLNVVIKYHFAPSPPPVSLKNL